MKWIKWYGQQWLNSTARYELNEAERGLFVDFCSLASCETIGLQEGQFKIASWEALAHKLNASLENVLTARDKCLQSRIGTEEVTGEGIIITILNWHKYQPPFRKEKEQTPPTTPVIERDKDNTILEEIRVPRKSSSNKHNSVIKTASSRAKITQNKEKYGEFLNVFLTTEEYKKLQEKFGVNLQEKIETLSSGIASKGYKYKNHYATILSWDRKDSKGELNGTGKINPRGLPKHYEPAPVYPDSIPEN